MKTPVAKMQDPPESKLDQFLRQAGAFVKLSAFAALFVYAIFHASDLSNWLSTITHIEAFNIKFDRLAAERKVDALNTAKTSVSSRDFAQGAIVRAAHVGEAVAGARVLWLDTNLPNNVVERQILEAMNIHVQRALTADEAQRLALQAVEDKEPYDLIISNVSDVPGKGPLSKCRVAFSQAPAGVKSSGSLDDLNTSLNNSPKMGFAFAEWLATNAKTADAYMRPEQPRLIFYSGSNGGIASSVCARIVTNFADILLHNVVSALEESRWSKMPPLQAAKPISKTSDRPTKPELDQQ